MDFSKMLIADFSNWGVYLHENQYFLGRTYLWAKRESALDLFDMNEEEKKELFSIGEKLRESLKRVFKPDLFNYCALGNIATHLHMHVIPRYKDKRVFSGIVFNDERWGKNYASYNYDFKVEEGVLLDIRDAIKTGMG